MSVEKRVWVYDLEQFQNFHSATFIDRDSDETRVFVIHESRNDAEAYYTFLVEEVAGLIGFNNINYDYPLIHIFLSIYLSVKDARSLVTLLHEESNKIIREEYSAIPEKDTKIPQLDLYRIHHFDNKAKRTSLKAVEIAINFPNVQDIPFDEYHYVKSEDIEEILRYNLNDVEATKKFYFLSEDMVELRKNLGKVYNLNLRNYNDPKIGQEIFGRQIAKKTGTRYSYLRDLRTYRRSIKLGDCLLPYIYFESKEFKELHEFFKNEVIETTYKAFEKSAIYKGFKYDYGTGGIHGCIDSGVYESTKDMMILDIDVAAYYPSLAIQNGFYPNHLGRAFVEVYSEMFETRMEAKRTGDKAVNSGLKLALNGVYGKSNDQYSLFYDPMYTMKITINGQLLLTMLSEWLVDVVKDLTMLQVNTDGITIMIPRVDEAAVKATCLAWEKKTGMILEFAEYKKMIIRDVNNYLAVDIEDNAKPKGAFEIVPMQNGAVAYNKNWSMRVVPKALHAYYIDGIDPEEFVRNHDNIYDFCIGFRARGDWDIWTTHIKRVQAGDNHVDFVKDRKKQQRTIRYYMSKGGNVLTKENRIDKRVISLEAGKTATMFNGYIHMADFRGYNIDYNYYIREINKIKNAVNDGQLKLF